MVTIGALLISSRARDRGGELCNPQGRYWSEKEALENFSPCEPRKIERNGSNACTLESGCCPLRSLRASGDEGCARHDKFHWQEHGHQAGSFYFPCSKSCPRGPYGCAASFLNSSSDSTSQPADTLPAEFPVVKFDSGHLMKVAPYTIVKSGSSEMCWTCSSSVKCAFSPHRGHGGKTSPWRIQTAFSQQPLCSQRYTPETGVMLPLSSVGANGLSMFP